MTPEEDTTSPIQRHRLRLAARDVGLATASGVLLLWSSPPLDLWPLSLVTLVPLLFAVRHATVGRAAALGWLTGFRRGWRGGLRSATIRSNGSSAWASAPCVASRALASAASVKGDRGMVRACLITFVRRHLACWGGEDTIPP